MSKIADFISIIIPGYNEANRILPSLKRLAKFCELNFEKYEIIFVDDGSTDQTIKMVQDIPIPFLKVISLDQNRGKGYAVKQGMLHAKGEHCFFTDADLPYDLKSFTIAINVLQSSGCDMIAGARDLAESSDIAGLSMIRKAAGRIFSAIVNCLLKTDVKDSQCGFKGFTKDAAKKIFSKSAVNGYAFDVEVFILAKKYDFAVKKIPVILMRKKDSKVNLICDAIFMSADILKLCFRRK